jgi:hypothetical protein
MRSLLPFDVVMVPLPDQEPPLAVNGLLKPARARQSRNQKSVPDLTINGADLSLLVKDLVIENMSRAPSEWFS